MANICNNGLICYWAGTTAFRQDVSSLSIFRFNLIMILYKNYIRILDGCIHIHS